MFKAILIILLIAESTPADEICKNWFLKSHIDSTSNGCELKCSALPKDMTTFDCANQCPDFCQIKKCSSDSYWKKVIKNGRPAKWDFPLEKSVAWKEVEKERVLKSLSRLPAKFKSLTISGIFRMQVGEIGNPGTTSENNIVLYDRTFDGPFYADRIIAHEMSHVLYSSLSANQVNSYVKKMNWHFTGGSWVRSGDFVDQNARLSPAEDFATNLEYFLFDSEKLKVATKAASQWFIDNFGQDFKLNDGCAHESSSQK